MWSLLLNTEITYKIRENGVCYTEIQAARLEALTLYAESNTIRMQIVQQLFKIVNVHSIHCISITKLVIYGDRCISRM